MADQSAPTTVFTPAAPADASMEDEARSASIVRQIEWYLGRTNLKGDYFLKRNMDDDLWVTMGLILAFPKMQKLIKESDEARLPHLLRSRSVTVEVNEAGDRIRSIWTVLSVLDLSGIPPNVSPVAIHNMLGELGDNSFPAWVHIYEEDRVWKVIFSTFEGAGIAAPKLNGKAFNGATIVAVARDFDRKAMIGDVASLLDGNRAIYTPPGTPSAFYPSAPDILQSSVVGVPSPGAPHPGAPIPVQGPYGNVQQPMMPISLGVQGMPQGYGFIPNPGFNSPRYQGNGVGSAMVQQGFNGPGYYNPYGGAPFDAAHQPMQQHPGQPTSPTADDTAQLQQQMAVVQLPSSDGAAGPSSGAGGASAPRPQNPPRRATGRGAGQPPHPGGMVMNPQDGMGIAPGGVNMAQIPQGALRMGADGIPIDSKGSQMQFVGMAHPLPPQPHVVSWSPQHPHQRGNSSGAGNDRQMRGNYPSGGRPRNQQYHHNSGDQIRGGGARGHNSSGGDGRGPHQGKKSKKAGRHHRQTGGPHNDRGDFEGRRDQRGEGGSSAGPSREDRRLNFEKKKQEPNLATMNFPPLPGATAEEGGTPAQGATKETPKEASKEAKKEAKDAVKDVVKDEAKDEAKKASKDVAKDGPKDGPKETPTQSESESNVTVSPDNAPAKSVPQDKCIKDKLTEKALPKPACDATGNGLEKSLEVTKAAANTPAKSADNPLPEDRCSTASDSASSDPGATVPKERPASQLSYAAALRKKAAANLASQGGVPSRNSTASPGPRGSGSKPSSPALTAKKNAPGGAAAELSRRRSVGATSNSVKSGGGADDSKAQSGGSPARPVAPSNTPNSVWANKPRSLFEPASSAPATKQPRSPSVPAVKSGSPGLKPVVAPEAASAKIPDKKMAGKNGGSSVPSKAVNGTGAPFLTEKISNETAAANASGSTAAAASASASPAKGAWATGAPKTWGAKESSGRLNPESM